MIAVLLLAVIIGFWLGTGWGQWHCDRGLPFGLRLYRAVTWLPCTVITAWIRQWLP